MTEIILPKVPEIYTVTTGYDDLIAERRQRFFEDVLSCIGYEDRARAAFINIDVRALNLPAPKIIETNDMITMLTARDYLVATVLVRRDDLNYCQVASAHYLTEGLVMKLREGIVT